MNDPVVEVLAEGDDVVPRRASLEIDAPLIDVGRLSLYYGDTQALFEIVLQIPRNQVCALIGPSGCGKSTLLRCINRLNDLIDSVRIEGTLTLEGQDIYAPDFDAIELRRRVGMVFQRSNPFPKSVYENVAYGLRIAGEKDRSALDEAVERGLKSAALWEEVKDRLDDNALELSGGQQQRLCIARALAVEPSVLLMDEPCSALDPIASARVEETIAELKQRYTIVIVTHNMQQASRVSDYTAFFYMGRLVEMGRTDQIFTNPRLDQTEEYVTGRFG